MSENTINSNSLIEEIKAPELNESNYATGLSDVFDNINDNFIKLANYDFIKGENGDSVIIKSEPLYANGNFTDIGEKLKNFIEAKNEASKTISYNNVTYDVWSTFKSSPGNLQMIYTVSNSENGISETPISSLYYVFLDGRFNHNNLKYINWEDSNYNDIIDLSCIVVYSNGEFKSLNNAFPTVYYERGVGLCWKINGNNTGLPVQGIQGRDGKDTKLFIVQGNGTTVEANKLSININKIFDGKNGFTSIAEYDFSNLEIDKDYSAVILTNIPGNSRNDFYFGSIRLEKIVTESEETLQIKGYADTNNTINTLIQNETLINLFKDINFKNRTGEHLPGIFIPIETPEQSNLDNNEGQAAHLIAATSITNNEGDSNLNNDMIWTPVNDISLGNNNSKSVSVDKYLYIKIDKNEIERVIKESWEQGNYESNSPNYDKFIGDELNKIIEQFNTVLSKTNYILKYKLIGTLRSDNVSTNNFLLSNSTIFDFTYNSNYTETTGSSDFISENKAQCLYSYYDNNNTILNLKAFNSVDKDSKPTNGNPTYISLNSLVDKLWYGYIPARNQNEITIGTDYVTAADCGLTGPNASEEFLKLKFDLKGDNKYITATRDYTSINLLPEYFIELIKLQKPIYRWKLDFTYNDFDNNLLKQTARPGTSQELSYILDSNDKKILILFNTIFTDTITPSEISQFLWFNGFSKDLRRNYSTEFEGIWNDGDTIEDKKDPRPYGVKTTKSNNKFVTTAGFDLAWSDGTRVSTILLSGWNYDNTKLFKFIQFVPIFNNDFKINDDTTLNINYNINVSGDKGTYNNKNITVNGALSSIEVNTNTLNALEIKNIYTNDNIVLGGDNSKISIKPAEITNASNIIYTELDSTNISTNNILSKSLKINDVNSNNKEFTSTIEYNYNNGIYKDLNILFQGENAINIEFNINPESGTESDTEPAIALAEVELPDTELELTPDPENPGSGIPDTEIPESGTESGTENPGSELPELELPEPETPDTEIPEPENPGSGTGNTSNSTPNPLHISISKKDQNTNDLVLKTNFNNIDITNNTAEFTNFTNTHVPIIKYITDNVDLAGMINALPDGVLNKNSTDYRVVPGSIIDVGNCTKETDNTPSQLKYRRYSNGTTYLGINELESTISEYIIPIFTKDTSSNDKYNVLSGLKYDNNKTENKFATDTNLNNLNKKFKLKINKIFTFIAGIHAERAGMKWPYLDNGNVKIKLRYTLINNNTKENIPLFDELVTTKSFNIIGNNWYGRTVWGNDVDSIYSRDRMHQFHFKIDTLTTSEYDSILTNIVNQLNTIQNNDSTIDSTKLQNYKLNVKAISSITANWRHPKEGIYGAFLTLPIVVNKFNDPNSSFKFTGGNNIMFSSNFNSVVWENYTTVTAATANNGTSETGWSMKFNTDYEYYLTSNSTAASYEPNLNLCGSGLYISNNYSTSPEVVGLGFDSGGTTKLIRKCVGAGNQNESSSITIADLINYINDAASNTEAQVGL